MSMYKQLLLSLSLLSSAALFADTPNRNFQVSFNGCTEFVGVGPIAATGASLLPAGFTANSFGPGLIGIVVRATTCQGIVVDGGPPRKAIVAHYGLNIAAPETPADIDNYTLVYATNHPELADRLEKTGLPVVYNPNLAVEDPAARPGNVFAAIYGEGLPPFVITGVVGDPVGSPFPFLANWWYSSKTGKVKMSTTFPAIVFGPSNLVVNTASTTQLGKLLGGNRDANFPGFNVRGSYPSALMTVTVTR